MKRIWAPWRMKFILEHDTSKCIFCELPRQENDRENLIVKRMDEVFILLNRYPYNNGHLMVAPYEHIAKISKLSSKVRSELMDGVSLCSKALEKTFNPEGMNIGVNQGKIAGAGFDEHVHFHIVPRWSGDTNFMPVLAETKVMADHLENTYKTLKKCF